MITNIDSNTIHIHKIEKFALVKDRPYKEQIEKYLHHLSTVLEEFFPLCKYSYHIVKEYDDVVIVKKLEDDDIDNCTDAINVNIISKKYRSLV